MDLWSWLLASVVLDNFKASSKKHRSTVQKIRKTQQPSTPLARPQLDRGEILKLHVELMTEGELGDEVTLKGVAAEFDEQLPGIVMVWGELACPVNYREKEFLLTAVVYNHTGEVIGVVNSLYIPPNATAPYAFSISVRCSKSHGQPARVRMTATPKRTVA